MATVLESKSFLFLCTGVFPVVTRAIKRFLFGKSMKMPGSWTSKNMFFLPRNAFKQVCSNHFGLLSFNVEAPAVSFIVMGNSLRFITKLNWPGELWKQEMTNTGAGNITGVVGKNSNTIENLNPLLEHTCWMRLIDRFKALAIWGWMLYKLSLEIWEHNEN